MSSKLINLFSNEYQASRDAKARIRNKLLDLGYTITSEYSSKADYIICIGGDGSFLETVHNCDFPDIPILGVNTGHLGFFQEANPEQMDEFIDDVLRGEYSVQELCTVNALVTTEDGQVFTHDGLNEIVIRGRQSNPVHLEISIDGIEIQKFSGDGIVVSTPAGSTAYNYSLGGSIVDPRLDLLQLTPMAPMNTTAYRSFTSSILLPPGRDFIVKPNDPDDTIFIINDGIVTGYKHVVNISLQLSDKRVKLIRFKDYEFWSKVKSKFL